jgi:hypothetical protein
MPFKTDLCVKWIAEGKDRCLWQLISSLAHDGCWPDIIIIAPTGFYTDFGSIPRDFVAWHLFGGKFNEEAAIHDYLYRIDSIPVVTQEQADYWLWFTLKESGRYSEIDCRVIWNAVHLAGKDSFHKYKVADALPIDMVGGKEHE